MSTFDAAIEIVLEQEGGYSPANANDPGGETNFGISKRQYPDLDIKNLSLSEAKKIYYRDFWLKEFELIDGQKIINKVFSIGVNTGMCHAIICLQRAIRAASGTSIKDDGIFGSLTINETNNCLAEILLPALKSECAAYYRMCNNPIELKGWLNRAYA